MYKLKTIEKTCCACPSQWEGYTEDNIPVYIRYRWGYLSVRLGKKDGDIMDAVKGNEIFGGYYSSDDLDGFLSDSDLENILIDFCFPSEWKKETEIL